MADALVSLFVESLATMAKEKVTTMAKEEVTMLLGAEDALRQLEREVRAFSGVLQDAERRAFTDTSIRRWLAGVKDLVYDADDIIDYSRTQAERMSTEEEPVRCYSPILLFFSKIALRHRTGNSIRSVNERVERIRKEGSDLVLFSAATAAPRNDDDHRGSSSSSGNQRQTSPILLEPNIVGSGIENDTSYLVGLLTKEEEELGGPRRMITLVAITGMGGVGKTTLAQKIYNHNAIKNSFQTPPPMWVCVSQQYSDEKLLKQIIRCAGGGDPGGDESFAELHCRLATVIKGKKIFLILDDVWAAKVWVDLLHDPLQAGAAAGSRVLITTRDESVANQMRAIQLHPVRPLTDEQSWSLLCKLVGFQEDGGSGDGGEVSDIGQQIAKKCHGLPLAIKTIAGVLMKKFMTRREWEKVLTDLVDSLGKLPDKVTGVLYLSYQDLPFYLKQCFIFCSLFPEDHVFQREQLTQLWVAEGFMAEIGGGDVLLEDVADDYYNELLSRSLLQREPATDEKCKMHDLLRSLAQFLAGDKYYFVGDRKQLINVTNTSSSSSLMKLRHLLFIDDTINHHTLTQVVKENESLRTLFLYGREHADDTMDFLFSKLGCLRVIDFCRSGVKSLPKSVENLIHLRYLNLKYSDLVELPESVGNLSNLQYLILNGCRNLKKLPRGIAKLYKLRCLDLEGCPKVDGLPAGIGRLQHLNCLPKFVTNEEDGWCSLEELRSLSQLRGTLTITKFERALIRFRGQPRERGFILKHMHHLRHLKLEYTYNYRPDGDDEKQKMQLIFEVELFPPPSLETFEIDGYFGKQLPAWGELPNLNELSIISASSVIGPEFMGMGVGALPFPMLRKLYLFGMENLVEWQWEAEDGVMAMPHLEVLNLHWCHKLRSLPGGLGSVTTLTTLSIERADSLNVIENLHSLKVLKVRECYNLTRVSNLPALQDIKVIECYALRQVEGLYSLQSLYIDNNKVESLPGWLLLKEGQPAFPMLKSLSIRVIYKKVLHRCLLDGPDWPKIQHYPQVDITDVHRLFVRYTKDPFTLTTNLEAYGSAGDGGATAYLEH